VRTDDFCCRLMMPKAAVCLTWRPAFPRNSLEKRRMAVKGVRSSRFTFARKSVMVRKRSSLARGVPSVPCFIAVGSW
jgi:hypothetical protein